MTKKYFDISKKNLSLNELESLLNTQQKILINPTSISKINKSNIFLNNTINQEDSLIYGVNTGFGSLCDTEVEKDKIKLLQENLILSHACGIGEVVPEHIVQLILLLKIRSLSFGFSGVRIELISELIDYYNLGVLPIIYEQGSLGASGDLAPLAHLSLPLLGKGEVSLNGKTVKTSNAFKKINRKPITLSYKEGLALLNGTQFMTAYGVWCTLSAKRLYYFSNLIAAISLEAFQCNNNPFINLVSKIRPHPGQIYTSELILSILKDSDVFNTKKKYVQDPYSFRCIPQVHGACFDVISHVESVFNTEINSVTDNPNVFAEEKLIVSAGNFHGQILAMAMDYLAISLCEIGSISERRVYKLISGDRDLPPYLIDNPGLNSGFMISQYTAASIVSQNKQYATPASVDSIMSSNGQEDHVSMGANSATKLYKVVDNLNTILAIELLNAAQAIDLRNIKKSSIIRNFLNAYRKEVPFINSDTQLSLYINKTKSFIDDYDINKLLKIRN